MFYRAFVGDIVEKYIEGQPQVSAVPVLPDEGGTVISGMDTEDKSVRVRHHSLPRPARQGTA